MLFMTTQESGPIYDAMEANQKYFGKFVSVRLRKTNDMSSLALWDNWCMDNGAFRGFNSGVFLHFLKSCLPYKSTCKFVAVPDVPFNWQSTLNMFDDWQKTIHRLGFPRAIAVQDGATVDSIPWSDVEAIFIGGSTLWKREYYADLPMFSHVLTPRDEIIMEAKKRGLWVHIGRQGNSIKQLYYAKSMGANGVDGTGELFRPGRYFNWISQTIWEIAQ